MTPTRSKLAAIAATAALGGAPSAALANSAASPSAHAAKTYGKYCQSFSHKRSGSQKTSPFTQCVVAMAKLAADESSVVTTPNQDKALGRQVCHGFSRQQVQGQKRSPFARCLLAAKQLTKTLQQGNVYGGY